MIDEDEAFYVRMVEQELDHARAATDASIKERHLNLASRYATQREMLGRGAPCEQGAQPAKGDNVE